MDMHFLDANGNHFVVPDAPEGYEREDATLIAPPPSPEHRWIDDEWQVPAPPAPSPDKIDAERDRRIAAGFTFQSKVYQSRPEDRENISGASLAALAAMGNGALPSDLRWHGGDSDFVWIAEDNSLTLMDAQTMFALGQTAMAHKQAHIFAARALKDAEPIPADYTDDAYWPSTA